MVNAATEHIPTMRSVSPFRYPGGKAFLYKYLLSRVQALPESERFYAEPFCGGAGSAVILLKIGAVDQIHLNDADLKVYSAWKAILEESERFAARIQEVSVDLETWHSCRKLVETATEHTFDLGFATFFLNRTSRSGIVVGAGPIGGYDQRGNWKVDARFNREALADRVRWLGSVRDRIQLTCEDALTFLSRSANRLPVEQTLFFVDPPYVKAGGRLYAQATVNRWQVILSHMLRMAKVWGMPGSDVNPLEGVKQKDPNNKVERFLSAAETQRLKRAVEDSPNPLLKHIVALLLLTGCRKRELLDARWDEFRLDQRTWRIPTSKTGKPRHVPLSDDAVAVLKALPRYEGCDFVIPNPETLRPFSSFYHSWDSARRAAGLPDVRVHDLRHSMASNMANSGQSLYVIGAVLGHSSPKTTTRYAHLSNETLHKAVNAAASVSGTTWGAAA